MCSVCSVGATRHAPRPLTLEATPQLAQTPTATPEHPGTYVQREVLPEGLTVTEAAQRLGIGRPALSRFLNGRSSLSLKMAQGLEREFGADAGLLQQMQARLDDSKTPAHHRTAAAKASAVPFVTAIKAHEIYRWANQLSARQELPVLLRRLVHSTARGVKRVDFPGHDQAERKGWDGRVEAAASTAWVPEGAKQTGRQSPASREPSTSMSKRQSPDCRIWTMHPSGRSASTVACAPGSTPSSQLLRP